MNPRQLELVQNSFPQVLPIAEQAAAMFYARLFTLDPTLRKLFKGDMQQQGVKLMQMMATAVHSLDDLPALMPVLRQLGARHSRYGVKPVDYDTVAEALLWTLAQGLGDAFTADVRATWETFYALAAQTMQTVAERGDRLASPS